MGTRYPYTIACGLRKFRFSVSRKCRVHPFSSGSAVMKLLPARFRQTRGGP